MGNPTASTPAASIPKASIPAVLAGADVSCHWIDVAYQRSGSEHLTERRFDNTPAGHRQLIQWLGRGGRRVRITLEASGIYAP